MMGIPRGESPETCTAGAGTLILEFGLLSRLTGNPVYMVQLLVIFILYIDLLFLHNSFPSCLYFSSQNAARGAVLELWRRRSTLSLVGNVINVATGYLLPYLTFVYFFI